MQEKIINFWKAKWKNNHIPFHQENVERALLKYFNEFLTPDMENVFVPLCGKSVDMSWLSKKGLSVTGIELSEIALLDFFKEQKIIYKKTIDEGVSLFQSEKIFLYQCDLFEMPESLKKKFFFDFIYDRASLIALNEKYRILYYKLMRSILKPGGRILLITFESLANPPKTPPYPISFEELKLHFGDSFSIKLLEENQQTKERVYLIQSS